MEEKVLENTAEVVENVDGEVVADEVTALAEHADDYKITAGDVGIISLSIIGAGTVAYGAYKGIRWIIDKVKSKKDELEQESDTVYADAADIDEDPEIAQEFDDEPVVTTANAEPATE